MDAFVARQPIVDRQQKIFGYELLFRKGFDNVFSILDGDQATAGVINTSFSLIGIETLTGGHRAFINFTRNLLEEEIATILPKDQVAIEILENVQPEPKIVEACLSLKNRGYLMVLDDFVFEPQFQPFIEMADIIKIDFIQCATYEDRKAIIEQLRNDQIKFLAEKVETREDFDQALELGYSYFQGYFFSKPVIVQAQDIPSSKMNSFLILKEVNLPEPDFNKIESIIKRDVSFTYKLLKFINSAAFGLNVKVKSLKHALVLLGIREVRKWVSLNAMRGLGKDKPNVLLTQSIIRGKFCELLAPLIEMRERSSDLFLLGIFSLIDAFIDRPMIEIITDLPLAQDVKQVLMGDLDGKLGDVLEIAIAFEKADWDLYEKCAADLGLKDDGIPQLYIDAVEWSDSLSNF